MLRRDGVSEAAFAIRRLLLLAWEDAEGAMDGKRVDGQNQMKVNGRPHKPPKEEESRHY